MPSDPPRAGLRERKKARTRAAIQTHALRLFREQGYEATTVQQIIDEAEVSESTFFRYFPTKADLVFTDELDPLILDAVRRQPSGMPPVAALRAAFHETFASLAPEQELEFRVRSELAMAVPELRAAMLDQFMTPMRLIAEAVGQRTGRPPDDPALGAFAGAVVGAVMGATMAAIQGPPGSFAGAIDEAMALLERGLVL